MSLRAGTDEVGFSPVRAWLGLVLRDLMRAPDHFNFEIRPVSRAELSDKAPRPEVRKISKGVRRRVCPLFSVLLLALPFANFAAQVPDPLRSPACLTQRAALEQMLDSHGGAVPKRAAIIAQQQAVSRACFGRVNTRLERSHTAAVAPAEAPRAAPSEADAAAATLRGVQVPAPTPPTLPMAARILPRPSTITACDPSGCWDGAGRRLNEIGPFLVGPAGLCISQAGLVNCP